MALDIKYGVSTWLWTSPFTTQSASELFPKIAEMGFDAVEIAVEDPALIDVKTVGNILKSCGLKALVCGAFGPSRDLTSDNPSVHQNCFDYIDACFQICEGLQVEFLGGPMYSAVGKARMLPPEQRKKEWNLAVTSLRKVCLMAETRNLKIALEPLNRFESDLVNTAEDVVRLVADIGHPAAHIMLDGFHMNIEERDLEKAIVCAGDKLIHVQVAENYRGTPGTGQTQWISFRKGLEAINYGGTVTIESFTPDNKELASAVCFWHPMADSQDAFASEGLAFLKTWAEESSSTQTN